MKDTCDFSQMKSWKKLAIYNSSRRLKDMLKIQLRMQYLHSISMERLSISQTDFEQNHFMQWSSK